MAERKKCIPNKSPVLDKNMTIEAVKGCFGYGKRQWAAGERTTLPAGEPVPPHFRVVGPAMGDAPNSVQEKLAGLEHSYMGLLERVEALEAALGGKKPSGKTDGKTDGDGNTNPPEGDNGKGDDTLSGGEADSK